MSEELGAIHIADDERVAALVARTVVAREVLLYLHFEGGGDHASRSLMCECIERRDLT